MIRNGRNTDGPNRIVRAAAIAIGLTVLAATGAQAQSNSLVVASFGGKIDTAFRMAAKPFEERRGISIRWIPGTAIDNAAKLIATRERPEYDMALLENFTQEAVSRQGVLAPVDAKVVPNYADLLSRAQLGTGVAAGFYLMGFFYFPEEIAKRGWRPPEVWSDLLKPETCSVLGFTHPIVSDGTKILLMFGGGEIAKIDDGIKNVGKLKNCIQNLEPSAAKFQEKVQLREYLLGAQSTIRTLPLIQAGLPIKFVMPKDMNVLSMTTLAIAKQSTRLSLAYELMNWLIGPEAQEILIKEAFYSPSNSKAVVPENLKQMGLPDQKEIEKAIVFDDRTVSENRRNWIKQFEREMAR